MLWNLAFFTLSLLVLIKSSEVCINYSSKIARVFKLSEFIVSFFIVAVISVFPEGSIAIVSAIEGQPAFGVSTVIGSIVADLALVFGIVAVVSRNGLKVRSEILRKDFLYLILLLLPVILGVDGFFSRLDGVVLIMGGLLFFFTLSIESGMFKKKYDSLKRKSILGYLVIFLLAMFCLLASAHFLVFFGTRIATELDFSVALLGLLVAAIGTCTPELFFSVRAVKTKHEGLAFGDILGTVIVDATVLLGIVSIVCPFPFDASLLTLVGVFMFFSGTMLIAFIKSDRVLTRKEGACLVLFYLLFVLIEFLLNINL